MHLGMVTRVHLPHPSPVMLTFMCILMPPHPPPLLTVYPSIKSFSTPIPPHQWCGLRLPGWVAGGVPVPVPPQAPRHAPP